MACDLGIPAISDTIEWKSASPFLYESNTSSIPIKILSEKLTDNEKKDFCITHFFNPVRYMGLLEIVKNENEYLENFGMAYELEYKEKQLSNKISKLEKRPIIKIKIKGDNLERDVIESKFTDLASKSLHFSWELSKEEDESSVLQNRPAQIDQELFKLAVNALKSEKLAHIAINELLPLLSTRQVDSATQVVIENFSNFSEKENDS